MYFTLSMKKNTQQGIRKLYQTASRVNRKNKKANSIQVKH